VRGGFTALGEAPIVASAGMTQRLDRQTVGSGLRAAKLPIAPKAMIPSSLTLAPPIGRQRGLY
jgi:hypothetical protein